MSDVIETMARAICAKSYVNSMTRAGFSYAEHDVLKWQDLQWKADIHTAQAALAASPCAELLAALKEARQVIEGPKNWRGHLADAREVKSSVLARINAAIKRAEG